MAESRPALTHSCRNTELSTMPGGRVEAEGDVGQAQGGLHVRVAALELADRLDRLDAVPAGLLLAGGDREGEAVDDDVLDRACPSCR